MTPDTRTVDLLEIRDLAARYASGVDRRDRDLFLSAFHPDARLAVYSDSEADEPDSVRQGHEELGQVPSLITRYRRTFHFVGQHRCEIDGDEATGEVYCIARHLTPDDHGGTDFVMHIRYQDRYRRDDGGWRIAERRVLVDWTEVQAASRIPKAARGTGTASAP